MAFDFAQAGKCLQVVNNMGFDNFNNTAGVAYTYVDVPGTTKSFQIRETGSLIVVEHYAQGWMNGSTGGCNNAIRWTSGTAGGYLGRGSSSNGDGWSRSGDGGEASRSWSNGRIHLIDHGLTAGSTIEITQILGSWSTAAHGQNWSTSYKSLQGWIATEFSRD